MVQARRRDKTRQRCSEGWDPRVSRVLGLANGDSRWITRPRQGQVLQPKNLGLRNGVLPCAVTHGGAAVPPEQAACGMGVPRWVWVAVSDRGSCGMQQVGFCKSFGIPDNFWFF